VLSFLLGSYIELWPPPLGFAPLLPNQKWHNQTPHMRSGNNYI